MASTKKDFNKRITVETVDGKTIPRHRAVMKMQETETKDGKHKVLVASDRVYVKMDDGSIRSTKQKVSKKERRRLREEAKKHAFPLPGATAFKPGEANE